MTTQVHIPSSEVPAARGTSARSTDEAESTFARPRWLLPALGAGLVAIGLVAAGVVSLSTMLFIGAFGGMLFMHAGGHGGHGGHAGGGGSRQAGSAGHAGHADPGVDRDQDLSPGSGGSQPPRSGIESGLEGRASNAPDQHTAHTCR